MTICIRRILFSIFILIFVVFAPIIILYSSGYKYDFRKNKFVRTGILVLSTQPEDVNILINNEKRKAIQQEEGVRFTELLPSEYDISVEKDGYHPWRKKLPIESQETTFASHIMLFKETLPELLIPKKLTFADQVDNNALYIEHENGNETLVIVNLISSKREVIMPLANQNPQFLENHIVFARFSSDGNRVVFQHSDTGKYYVLDMRNPLNLLPITNKYEKVMWSNIGNHTLHGMMEDSIYEENLNSGNLRLLATIEKKDGETISTEFFVDGSNIYFFRQTENNIQLELVKTFPSQEREILIQLPSTAEATFLDPRMGIPHFKDTRDEKIYIFDTKDRKNVRVISGTDAKRRGNVWTIHNGFEISIWNTREDKQILVNRYSREIEDIAWYPRSQYLLFSFKDSVHIIELDTRDFINDYELVTFDEAAKPILSSDGNFLYFNGSVGKQHGLYRLELREE